MTTFIYSGYSFSDPDIFVEICSPKYYLCFHAPFGIFSRTKFLLLFLSSCLYFVVDEHRVDELLSSHYKKKHNVHQPQSKWELNSIILHFFTGVLWSLIPRLIQLQFLFHITWNKNPNTHTIFKCLAKLPNQGNYISDYFSIKKYIESPYQYLCRLSLFALYCIGILDKFGGKLVFEFGGF